MKIFSLKTILGVAAIGGAAMYVRKQGGLRTTYDKLLAKKDELLAAREDEPKAGPRSRAATAPAEASTL